MKGLSFPAWRQHRYLSLAELVEVLRSTLPQLAWRLRIDEAAPGPGATELDELEPTRTFTTSELLLLASRTPQIIDGAVHGFLGGSSEPWIVIQAVDSTSWDVLSASSEVLQAVRGAYPDALEIPESA